MSPEHAPGTHLSQRMTALATGLERTSVRRIAKRVGLKALRKLRVHKLPRRIRETETVQRERVRLSAELLRIPHLEDCIIMTDEKVFTLEAPFISQNERVYTAGKKVDIAPDRLLRPTSHLNFQKKLMVSVGLSMRGKVFIHIFEEGERIDGYRYRQLLVDTILPACARLYPDLDFILQQDGAPSHTAHETQDLLYEVCPRFIPADKWPAYSPDANVVDYRGWADGMQFVYANGSLPTLDALRGRILAWWDQLPTARVQSWMRELRPRLQKIIDQRGWQIEQYFNKI